MTAPHDLQYTATHEWVQMEGECARIGLTAEDPANFTTATHVDLPAIGSAVKAGEHVATVAFSYISRNVSSPISGTVMEVNRHLWRHPHLVNSDPYGAGWLFRLKVEAGEEIEHLQDPSTYQNENRSDSDAGI